MTVIEVPNVFAMHVKAGQLNRHDNHVIESKGENYIILRWHDTWVWNRKKITVVK